MMGSEVGKVERSWNVKIVRSQGEGYGSDRGGHDAERVTGEFKRRFGMRRTVILPWP